MEDLKSNFSKHYSDKEILPTLHFKPKGKAEKRVLVIGSEHGDKVHGTLAMIDFMHQLNDKPLKKLHMDFVPVIDIKGYPGKRTIIGDEGFGKPKYLDAGYRSHDMPEEISCLLNKISGDYDLAVQLNTVFKEEAPLINGNYVVPQIQTEIVEVDGKFKQRFNMGPEYMDLVGAVINGFASKGVSLLTASEQGYLGDGHVLGRPGLVIPGEEDNDGSITPKTRNLFSLKCAKNNIASLEIVSLANKLEPNNKAAAVHKIALETLVKLYEN